MGSLVFRSHNGGHPVRDGPFQPVLDMCGPFLPRDVWKVSPASVVDLNISDRYLHLELLGFKNPASKSV